MCTCYCRNKQLEVFDNCRARGSWAPQKGKGNPNGTTTETFGRPISWSTSIKYAKWSGPYTAVLPLLSSTYYCQEQSPIQRFYLATRSFGDLWCTSGNQIQKRQTGSSILPWNCWSGTTTITRHGQDFQFLVSFVWWVNGCQHLWTGGCIPANRSEWRSESADAWNTGSCMP